MQRYVIYVLVFAASFLGAQVIDAATYYVAKTGNNNNSCTSAQNPSTPKLTISAGLGCLSGGDTLVIKEGTYAEFISGSAIPSGTASARTIVKAETAGTVVIKPTTSTPGGPHVVLLNLSRAYITLDGLTISGANLPAGVSRTALKIEGVNGSEGGAQNILIKNVTANDMADGGSCVQVGGANHRLTNVRVFNCLDTGSIGAHGIYFSAKDSIIEQVHISNVTGTCLQFYHTSNNPTNNTMLNSICHDSGGRGIYAAGSGHKIFNTVIYNTGLKAGSGGIRAEGNSLLIRNNIIGGQYVVILNNGSNNTISHILCSKSGTGCNIIADPKFVNVAGRDFHLRSDSPAINQGINLAGLGITTDAEGNPRPEPGGTLYDIGPYECQNLAGASCGAPPPQPVPETLVAHYTADNTFTDSSGNGFHLTANGGMVATGAPIIGSNDFLLDGIDDYASLSPLPSLLKPTDGICLSAWVKTSDNDGRIISVGGSPSLSLNGTGRARFYTQFAGTNAEVTTTSTAVANNVPHHLVGTYDQASGLRIYLDGAQQGFQSATDALVYPADLLTIGRRASPADQFLTGIIGQVKIFNFPCTPEAVVNLFNEQAPLADISSTHLAWINPTTGSILGSIDASRNHRINERLGVRSSIASGNIEITEFFPLVVCDVANCESDVDWIEVTGTVNALGLVLETDPIFVMGDSTNALFNLAGFTFTQGRYVIPTINETVKTGLGAGVVTEWEYRRIRFTSPAVAGKQYKFRLLRENRSPFPNYASAPVLTLLPPIKGRVFTGCDDSGIMNR